MKRRKFSTEQRAHWRWLLYVVLALAADFSPSQAPARTARSDDATSQANRRLLRRVEFRQRRHASQVLCPGQQGLVFYDIAPFSYHGWKGISRRR